jgi:VanZ family protein
MKPRIHDKATKRSASEFCIRLLAPLIWAGCILWLSLTPAPPKISGVLGWDKLLHAGAYGLLSFLIAQFLACTDRWPSAVTLRSAWVVAVSYGALVEILQLLAQTGRTAEWWDLFADMVGAFIGCVLFRQLFNLFSSRRKQLGRHNG